MSRRVQSWKLRSTLFDLTQPRLMAIINVTPDSFSDGGRYLELGQAVDQALQAVADGAAILDVGGESTRPYASPVDVDEEWRRVGPVVETLCRQVSVPVSIDTTKAEIARRALDAGAEIVNDISGCTMDADMPSVLAASGAGVCAMHMQGTPQTMQDEPRYQDVVGEILLYLRERDLRLQEAGVEAARICLDPGIGFGKTHQHNLQLIRECQRFHELGRPLLVGHSRKGFIAHVMGNSEWDREPGTIAVALRLAQLGVQVIRVHDVAAVHRALTLFAASGGLDDFAN